MANLSGATLATLAVALSTPVTERVTVGWHTVDGTAYAGIDYEQSQGTLVFEPGDTSKNIQVPIYGRGVGTDERRLQVRLHPPVNAVLARTAVTIAIRPSVNPENQPILDITVPDAPPGPPGNPGDPGDPGAPGREVELRASETHAQWRYVGDAQWLDLVPLSELQGLPGEPGTAGDNGREIELQKNATHLQWRHVGDTSWRNLAPLADLKGESGTGLTNRGSWAAGTFQPGDYVFSQGSSAASSMWILSDEAAYESVAAPHLDASHWIEFEAPAGADGAPGTDGADGREIEIQKGATHLQWRYTGAPAWTDLVALADIRGTPGTNGTNGTDGTNGTNGREVQIQKGTTHIQWRYVGDAAWTNLVALADLKGEPGTGGGDTVTFATQQQALAAESNTVASTPARVREFIEQFGFGATYTNEAADLNTVVRARLFNYSAATLNTPAANSHGRGLCIPSGTGYVTQVAIENTTAVMSVRYQEAGTWTAWAPVGGSAGGGTAYVLPRASATVLGGVRVGTGLAISAEGVLSATGGGTGGTGGGADASVVKKVLAADIGTTETTLTPAFAFDLVAGHVYEIQMALAYRTTAVEKGIRVGFTGNAGIQTVTAIARTAKTNGDMQSKPIASLAGTAVFLESFIGGDNNLLLLEGMVFCTGTGTFNLCIGSAVLYDYCAAQKSSYATLTDIGVIPV